MSTSTQLASCLYYFFVFLVLSTFFGERGEVRCWPTQSVLNVDLPPSVLAGGRKQYVLGNF